MRPRPGPTVPAARPWGTRVRAARWISPAEGAERAVCPTHDGARRERVAAGSVGCGPGCRQNSSRASLAVSLGVLPTLTPAASRASFFAAAVPEDPDTIAPACPIVLPSGAVNPAT
ncbi:hypothetical protein SAMN02745673_02391 [Marinactinospora thermotolerans DSM 45154]|uniref:Uncharacterized protein n=1 Tax=Marinactinospora thermotolerans DSM 45154 TaxID=1122192 RepID=A0A1T4QRS8_9ACTN|nr:hypothetical protein SAMN02745673_02391 [Marinactinospora thermotolerans DSM 45154]